METLEANQVKGGNGCPGLFVLLQHNHQRQETRGSGHSRRRWHRRVREVESRPLCELRLCWCASLLTIPGHCLGGATRKAWGQFTQPLTVHHSTGIQRKSCGFSPECEVRKRYRHWTCQVSPKPCKLCRSSLPAQKKPLQLCAQSRLGPSILVQKRSTVMKCIEASAVGRME